MLLSRKDWKIVAISLGVIVFLATVFKVCTHDSLSARARHDAGTFISEEMAILEEKKQQEKELAQATSTLRVPILVYHSVRPHIDHESKNVDAYDITPELFEMELKYLRDEHFEVITMDEMYTMTQHGDKNPDQKKVILSFDDGWENQYTYAFPLLQKYAMPAIFYVYTKPIGYKNFLSWDNLKEMKEAGMEIGSHTVTHPFFKKSSAKDLRRELSLSKKTLEEKLQMKVNHFAAPFGYSNEEIEKEVKAAGYTTGRTIFHGYVQKNEYALRAYLATDSFTDFVNIVEKKK